MYYIRDQKDWQARHHKHDKLLPIKEKIFKAIAQEQESLARILAALAVKVEKTAGWLPDKLPDEPVNQIVEKVKGLECVIGQEIAATANKEKSIHEILHQLCQCGCEPKPEHHCPCPCHLFQVCKIVGHCVSKTAKYCSEA